MSIRILFAMLNAQPHAAPIEQLADALSPHRLVIHHDHRQAPDFRVGRPNVALMPDPHPTSWGDWSITQAILRTVEHCLERYRFDYLQLLSPACLPIRPMAAFEHHVAANLSDVNLDAIDLTRDASAMMCYGYRALAPAGSFGFRVLRRLRSAYFGRQPRWTHRAGIVVLQPREARTARIEKVGRRARDVMEWTMRRVLASRPPYGRDFHPAVGSTWFGARRAACEYIVARARDPALSRYFSHLHISDEMFVQSIVANSDLRRGPSNHIVNWFDRDGHPHTLQEEDLPRILASGRFFARKFPLEADAPVRRAVLAGLDDARWQGRALRALPGRRTGV